jgi:hypothetical protein
VHVQTRIQAAHWRSRERAPALHAKLDRWAIRADLMGWVSRWSVMARLVAMGYNVMMLDTDVVLNEHVYPCVPHLCLFASPPVPRRSLFEREHVATAAASELSAV